MPEKPSSHDPSPYFQVGAGSCLRDLVKDETRLAEVVNRGRERATTLITTIRGLVTPQVGVGLLHGLAMTEVQRATQMAVRTTPSDLCGQARYLRGLIVAQSLDPDGFFAIIPTMTVAWESMMAKVRELWNTLFFLERLESELSKKFEGVDERQVEHASIAASFGRTDVDMGFVAPVEERCRELFAPLDDEFVVPTFGLTSDLILAGFSAMQQQSEKRYKAVRDIAVKGRGAVGQKRKHMVRLAMQDQLERALEMTAADLPESWADSERQAFLSAFSLTGGEHNPDFFWPSHDNVTTRKPLLRLSGDRYYLMDPIFCRYAPYRLLCHAIDKSPLRARCLRLRDMILEKRAGQLFAAAIRPTIHYAGGFLPTAEDGRLAEQDHIFVADGHAFLVECKAKRVRSPLVHGGNASKVASDIRASVQAGFEQGDRARRHMMAETNRVKVFDKFGTVVGEIERSAITTAHVIVVTWDSLCPLSIDLAPWLKVPDGTEYPWAIWIDDLQTAVTRLRPASAIASYVAWRSTLNGRLWAGDELHAVGAFLAKHTEFPAGRGRIVLNPSYAHIFDDDFFASRGTRRKTKPPDAAPAVIELRHENGVPTAKLNGQDLSQESCGKPESSPTRHRFKKRKRGR